MEEGIRVTFLRDWKRYNNNGLKIASFNEQTTQNTVTETHNTHHITNTNTILRSVQQG